MRPEKVLVFGGTHGNEWTGVYAVTRYADQLKQKYQNLNLEFIFANPEAHKINKRFKDEDLNRAFEFLHENRETSYEHQRAKEIKKMIKDDCFVIDLHTTTSNMGNTVIISHANALNFHVAKKLTESLEDTRIIYSPDPNRKYLASQSQYSMMIEVGPVPNGVINSVTLEGTLSVLNQILTTLSTLTNLTTGSVEIYEEIEDVYYPQSGGELTACIHPDFQGKDFEFVEGEYTPFKSFTGENLRLQTKEKLYPIFINEAAYYPTRLAYTLCRKKEMKF